MALLLVFGLGVVGLIGDRANFAYAAPPENARKQGPPPCSDDSWSPHGTPNDFNYFPYGFLCGSDTNWINNVPFSTNPATNVFADTPITGGQSFVVTGQFLPEEGVNSTTMPKGRNGENSSVLVWTYIDINNSANDGIDSKSLGGEEMTCPGTGAQYLPVAGHRDLSVIGDANGRDQSPFAFAGGDVGRVDCGEQGRVIVWKNASGGSSRNYSFRVKLKNDASGRICVRQTISTLFSTDYGGSGLNSMGGKRIFNPSSEGHPLFSTGDPDDNTVASHIVKQSRRLCYMATPKEDKTTRGGSTNALCTQATVQVGQYFGYKTRVRVNISGATPGVTNSYVYSDDEDADNDGRGDRTYFYTPTNNLPGGVVVRVDQAQFQYVGTTGTPPFDGTVGHRQNGQWYSYSTSGATGTFTAGPCYHAACDVDVEPGGTDAPGGKATAGSTVTLRLTLYNNVSNGMELRSGMAPNHPLALEKSGGSAALGKYVDASLPQEHTPIPIPTTPPPYPAAPSTIPVGGIGQAVFHVQAIPDPATGGAYATLNLQPAYVNRFAFGTGCSVPIPIYQPPVVSGSAQCPSITGVAYHPEVPGMIIDVHAYVGPNFVGAATANGPGQSFVIPIPDAYMNGLDYTFTLYAIDPFGVQNGVANAGMVGCGKFYLDPSTDGEFAPSAEDPATFSGTASVAPVYPGWHPSASRPALPGTGSYQYTKNGTPVAGTFRAYPHTSFINRTHPGETINIIPPVVVGDRYCLELTISNAMTDNASIAYIRRDGVVIRSSAAITDPGCQRIENKPFQKVYGSAVSAGGAFKTAADGSCTGGGTGFLGGWFNNTYGGTYHYGASTELSALAMVKTVGFASAQTVADRSPTELSFANNVAADKTPTSSTYSPGLGGGFEGAACIEPLELPTNGVTAIGTSVNVGALSGGAYSVSGNTTINGGVLTPGADSATTDNITILVNGDVRINSNITYGGTSWRYNTGDPKQSTTPSFVLKATGNIYISNNVTVLDGQYVAQPRADGSGGGNLYTCAASSGWAPMAKDAMFDGCKNQLTVHGAFVADKVRLMRTYGTLRNEKPTITAETTITETINRSRVLYRYACGSKHTYSVQTSISGCTRESALGGILPTQSSDAGRSSTAIYMWTDDNPSLFVGYGFSPTNGACSAGHRPVGYVHNTGNNTYLYSLNPAAEAYGYPVAFPVFCLLPGGNQGGEVRTTTVPSALVPPASLPPAGGCSNAGVRSSPRETCAAEVFEYTPELHLSTPALRPENGDGAKPFDAITSLPPVL